MGYKNSLEWQIGSVKYESIAFLTHGSFLTGQRERYLTVYPFANMILNGCLANNSSFQNFKRGEVFIFCNYRPKGDCRPDLLAFSSKGDVFLVEGKQRRKGDEVKALKNIETGAGELLNYLYLLNEFSKESSPAPYESWESVYSRCYVNIEKHGFPELDKFISNAISIYGIDKINDLFKEINENISQRKILFGLAFNDPDDVESFFSLDSFDLMPRSIIEYKTNPKEGVRKLGYSKIDDRKIYQAAEHKWDKRLGQLFLFGIDKEQDNFRILNSIK